MKSPQKMLAEASDLVAIARITRRELVSASVNRAGICIQVQPAALVRVYKLLRPPESRVEASVDDAGSMHMAFTAKGARWVACVLAMSDEGRAMREAIDGERSRSIGHRQETLLLPSPGR